jgi:2-keto-3-deoxy-L-fuconate dehydrogenase
MFSLQGKTAVVTGGGSGIGKAIAGLFARQGAFVVVADLNAASAEEMVNTIQAESGRAMALPVNVADQAALKVAIAGVVAKFGRIDILVNSAGISHIGKLDTTSESDFDRIVQAYTTPCML